MSANHFIAIASRVARNPADGMLVFGLGKDAEFWRALNHGSRLTIIEDDPTWIERKLIPDIELIQVDYTSRVGKPSALGELSKVKPIARMGRFVRNNGIIEGFHRKMKLIQRRAYGFRNFENYRMRVIAQGG